MRTRFPAYFVSEREGVLRKLVAATDDSATESADGGGGSGGNLEYEQLPQKVSGFFLFVVCGCILYVLALSPLMFSQSLLLSPPSKVTDAVASVTAFLYNCLGDLERYKRQFVSAQLSPLACAGEGFFESATEFEFATADFFLDGSATGSTTSGAASARDSAKWARAVVVSVCVDKFCLVLFGFIL
jgi:hypothetical protein